MNLFFDRMIFQMLGNYIVIKSFLIMKSREWYQTHHRCEGW